MKAHLLFKDKSIIDVVADERLSSDLELSCIIDHMADSDDFIAQTVYCVFAPKNSCRTSEEILYRQEILSDCMKHPADIRKLYQMVTQLVKMDRSTRLATSQKKAKYMLDVTVKVMLSMREPLTQLCQFARQMSPKCQSEGLHVLLEGLIMLFDPDMLKEMKGFMEELSPSDGISAAAVLGKRLRAEDYHPCRKSGESKKGFLRFLQRDKNKVEFDVDMADQEASPALNRLRDDLVIRSASVIAQSRYEMFLFLKELQKELSFYIGCLNLYDHMQKLGLPVSFPVSADMESSGSPSEFLSIEDLYNLSLSLMNGKASVPNNVRCDKEKMIIITGSNQGGKTTFLRSLGQALLMMKSGMFTASARFCATPGRVFTHFIREEDKALKSGKLDEELVRMREITDKIRPGDWLLLNESFASTNEEEGSEIALEIITAMFDQGVRIIYVTHFYYLVRLLEEQRGESVHFLNALRDSKGNRTFRLMPGDPVVRGYGEDLYHEIFTV